MTPRRVTTIPATINNLTALPITNPRKRRVAGYARVSTDHEDQMTSYEAQVDYYTNYIKSRADWEFVNIYTDEGISATNTRHRDGFKRMVTDAMDGKIDLIVTKSVSRFARNTVDSLTTVRKLKDKGIEIYFEKENIWTLDAKGELLITIMSSLAQEESRSISENVKWGHRKRFADGKVSMPYGHFLGYDKGEDGIPVINPKQAETVKLIYQLFLEGYTFHSIARELTAKAIPTPGGKTKWSQGTVKSILTNEKYKGDALLQKCFTVNFLTKEKKKNEGEVPQYYVEHSHEAIISQQVFDWVQEEIRRRLDGRKRYSGVSMFSSKIKCGECGGWYGAKVWHSTDKYRRTVYRCNEKFNHHCKTPHLDEQEIKDIFVKAVNKLISDKEEVLSNLVLFKEKLTDTAELAKEKDQLAAELSSLAEKVQSLINENARIARNQEEYNLEYAALAGQYEERRKEYEKVCNDIQKRRVRAEQMDSFIEELKGQELVKEFNEKLWCSLVDCITVYDKDDIQVTFKDGTNIKV